MRTIAIINQKGGCGKTTCSINLAAALAQEGQRTLLVDMDPQSHCALGLAVPEAQIKYSSAELMRAGLDGSLGVDDVVWQIARFFDLIPSSMSLAAIEAQLQHAPDKDRRLAQVLSTCQDKYDFCIIDCPPSIGLLTFNALRAATEVVVPVETGYFSMEGAKKQHRTIEMLARRAGHNVQFSILPTMYDVRTKLAREILAEIKRHFTGHLLPQVINFNAKLKEAASFGQPITEYDAASRGMQDFEELAQHLIANPPARPQTADDLVVEDNAEDGLSPGRSRAAELVERARALSQRSAELSQRLNPTPGAPGNGTGNTPGSAFGTTGAQIPGAATPNTASPVIPGRSATAGFAASATPTGTSPGSTGSPSIAPDHMFGTGSSSGASASNGAAPGSTTASQPSSGGPSTASRGASRLSGIMSAAGLKPTPGSLADQPATQAPPTAENETGFYAPGAHQQPTVQPATPGATGNDSSDTVLSSSGLDSERMFGTGSASPQPTAQITATNVPAPQSTLMPDSSLQPQIPENMDPRIADLYGVRKTSQGLLFVQPVNGATSMAIAGDFNGWNPQQTKLKVNEEHNVWQAVIPVPPGRYRYRLVVDGKWIKDPYNTNVESNPFGELNNVIVVKS